MIREAIEKVIDISEPTLTEIDGYEYSDKKLYRIDPPSVSPVRLSTLDSLIAIINDPGEFKDMNLGMIHVESPTRVTVKSRLIHDHFRDTYFECVAELPELSFDRYLSAEEFNIMLQANFIGNEDREKVLMVVGNIRSEQVQTVGDDGISQQVEVKAGIARVATANVPNPVALRPFRTFLEVEQPESSFVLRMKEGPHIALFEADGGKWQLEAMKNIQSYIKKHLNSNTTLVIA